MLSHAQTGRSQVCPVTCEIQVDTEARLAIFAIVEKNHGVKVNRGRAESMCRLTHVIPSMPIKDHTIVGASVEIECMSLTQLAE